MAQDPKKKPEPKSTAPIVRRPRPSQQQRPSADIGRALLAGAIVAGAGGALLLRDNGEGEAAEKNLAPTPIVAPVEPARAPEPEKTPEPVPTWVERVEVPSAPTVQEQVKEAARSMITIQADAALEYKFQVEGNELKAIPSKFDPENKKHYQGIPASEVNILTGVQWSGNNVAFSVRQAPRDENGNEIEYQIPRPLTTAMVFMPKTGEPITLDTLEGDKAPIMDVVLTPTQVQWLNDLREKNASISNTLTQGSDIRTTPTVLNAATYIAGLSSSDLDTLAPGWDKYDEQGFKDALSEIHRKNNKIPTQKDLGLMFGQANNAFISYLSSIPKEKLFDHLTLLKEDIKNKRDGGKKAKSPPKDDDKNPKKEWTSDMQKPSQGLLTILAKYPAEEADTVINFILRKKEWPLSGDAESIGAFHKKLVEERFPLKGLSSDDANAVRELVKMLGFPDSKLLRDNTLSRHYTEYMAELIHALGDTGAPGTFLGATPTTSSDGNFHYMFQMPTSPTQAGTAMEELRAALATVALGAQGKDVFTIVLGKNPPIEEAIGLERGLLEYLKANPPSEAASTGMYAPRLPSDSLHPIKGLSPVAIDPKELAAAVLRTSTPDLGKTIQVSEIPSEAPAKAAGQSR